LLNDNLTWSADPQRHLMRFARHCRRDAIFDDLCDRLEAARGRKTRGNTHEYRHP